MFSGSLLLVLISLSCLQFFTIAEDANGASLCCFEFHKKPIPAVIVASYEETRFDCPVRGVILTTRKGFRLCADPGLEWVRQIGIAKNKTLDLTPN